MPIFWLVWGKTIGYTHEATNPQLLSAEIALNIGIIFRISKLPDHIKNKQTGFQTLKIKFYICDSFIYQKINFHFRFNITSSGSLFICYMWIWNQSSSNRAVQKLAGNKNIQVKNGQLLLSVNWIYLGQFICDSGFFNWFRTFGPISTTFVFKVYQNNGPLIMKNDL